jgi:predicted ester cyclase
MRIRNILAAALIATSASMPTALSRQTVQPAVAYTAFPAPEGRAVFEEPTEQARVAARIVHEDYIQHNRLVEHGRRGLLAFMPHLFGAIPDARFIVHDVFATEERVVTRWTLVGTLTGDGFLGVAPKGQRIEFDGIDVWTIKDGQLHEHWDQFDWPRVFVQLGLTDLPRPFYGVAAQPYSR